MSPYDFYLRQSGYNTYQQFYSALEFIAKYKMGLDGLPFPQSALEHPPGNVMCPGINAFLSRLGSADRGDKSDMEAPNLVKFLKENPPKESYENPIMPDTEPTKDEKDMIKHIFGFGIDLPGSKDCPFGHLQYYTSFFIDMYFGNYTEFNDYVKGLTKEELNKALNRREGYCQFSPIFAPILGLRMVEIESKLIFTPIEVRKIRSMYSGCNENKHLKILKKLIKLGADINANDIHGFTPLQHAVLHANEGMIMLLLKHGANPNTESRHGYRPLNSLIYAQNENVINLIDVLIKHNARLTTKDDINNLRSNVEAYGSKEVACRVREAHPREKGECEKCTRSATKKCAACGLASYCTPACQKLDWVFHKITCRKKKQEKQSNKVD